MKKPKFVRVIGEPRPRAGKDGRLRKEGDILNVGAIVPVEWFEDTPDAVFVDLINPAEAGGRGVLEEFQPGTAELAVLREYYPEAFTALTPDPSPKGEGEDVAAKRKTRTTKEEDGE